MVFQNLTYNRETPCCNPKPIPVLLIMTGNAPAAYDMQILQKYQQTLNGFVGPTGSRFVSLVQNWPSSCIFQPVC